MIKTFLKIIALAFPLLGFTLTAQAAFIATFDDQKIAIDQPTLDSFYGYNQINKNSLVTYPPETFDRLVARSLGSAGPFKQNLSYYHFRPEKIYAYVKTLAEQIDVPVVEPELAIENGRAINFAPPQNGLKLDIYASTFNILSALEKSQDQATLEIAATSPEKSLAGTNNLGIRELVGEGVSNFSGSPQNRRHNIKVGVGKFKGVIVPQGAAFSFNKILGPVEEDQGFLPELVIKKEGTIPELGGGLCQVSTTTFRAAMNAGVPITARRNHAYAVQYYSPQGTDATIYPGSSDLKFINDTPGAILIWPYEKDNNTLVFNFYGTKDGRQVTLEKPVVYDRKSDGSMKATWTREVTLDGKTRTDVFQSVYQSPALFHKTEAFVSATATPSTAKTQ